MHALPEYRARDGRTDERCGDVVQEAGKDEDEQQEHEPALPVLRQDAGQRFGHPTVFEMPRQDREADQ